MSKSDAAADYVSSAFNDGKLAKEWGLVKAANPYDINTAYYEDWNDGWDSGEYQNKDEESK